MCGRWEAYPREFAKCRRCRKAKYCGKECQSTAWSEGHRFWCSARDADEDGVGDGVGVGVGASQQQGQQQQLGQGQGHIHITGDDQAAMDVSIQINTTTGTGAGTGTGTTRPRTRRREAAADRVGHEINQAVARAYAAGEGASPSDLAIARNFRPAAAGGGEGGTLNLPVSTSVRVPLDLNNDDDDDEVDEGFSSFEGNVSVSMNGAEWAPVRQMATTSASASPSPLVFPRQTMDEPGPSRRMMRAREIEMEMGDLRDTPPFIPPASISDDQDMILG